MTSIYWYFRKKDELLDAMTDNRYIGFADDIDFDYILDSILDHAQQLIGS